MNVAVIGAGASGMTAALQAARHGAEVTLFERNATVGRKLLVTGSGHCNITNEAVSAKVYACAETPWLETLLGQFGVADLLDLLASIGIPTKKTADGWYYPLSNSAQSVVEAFASAVQRAGIALLTDCQVTGIRAVGQKICVCYSRDEKEDETGFDRVIVSAGGCAYPTLGSRGELFPMLNRLGHSVLPNRPALAPLVVDLGKLKALQGIRLDVQTGLWKGPDRVASSRGNLIFTEWGLNGPAVMDISHQVTLYPAGALALSLNFLAFFQEEFDRRWAQNRKTALPVCIFLDAFFPPRVSAAFLRMVRIPESTALAQIDDSLLDQLKALLTDTRLPVNGVRGFEYCQISAGGVPVTEVDPSTMESRRVKGLYLTGETLDVVGPCGGYNLQFAFSSGALAGRAAAG